MNAETARPAVTAPIESAAPTVADPQEATALRQPVSVGASLHEAEQAVLASFDPTRDPRIEWSKYVERDALLDSSAIDHALFDWWPPDSHVVPATDLPEVVFIVAASSFGLDDLTPRSEAPVDRWPIDNCDPPVRRSPQREEVVGVFDPYSGARKAAWNLRRGMDALYDLPSLRATVSGQARRTATPEEPLAVPPKLATAPAPAAAAHRTLTLSALPEALRPTFEVYPLAPGTSWTWRVTTLDNRVRPDLSTYALDSHNDWHIERGQVTTRPTRCSRIGGHS